MASLLEIFAKNLKEFRTQKKIYQGELSRRTEIHQARLSRIENGQVDIGLATLEKIADGLEVTPGDLLLDPDRPETALDARLVKVALLSTDDQQIIESLIDSLLEKAQLQKDMNAKVKKRLEELGEIRRNKN